MCNIVSRKTEENNTERRLDKIYYYSGTSPSDWLYVALLPIVSLKYRKEYSCIKPRTHDLLSLWKALTDTPTSLPY